MALVATNRLRKAAVVATAAAAAIGLTVRHQANALRANELAQQRMRSSAAASTPSSAASQPNLYVSVDRSGGGI